MQNKSNLYNRVVEIFKNDSSSLSNALQIFNFVSTDYTTIIKSENKKLLLSQKKQLGGKKEKIVINKNDYYYNIESSKPLNSKYENNEIQLLTNHLII